MKKINLDFINCDICDNNKFSLFSTMPADEGWQFEPKEFSYVRCNKSGLLYINSRPKPKHMFEYYNKETVQADDKVDGHVSSYFHNYNKGASSHIANALLEQKKLKNSKKVVVCLKLDAHQVFF